MRLSSEQIEFRDLVRRAFSEQITAEYRRQRISSGTRNDPALRQVCKDLGLYEAFSGTQAPCGSSN